MKHLKLVSAIVALVAGIWLGLAAIKQPSFTQALLYLSGFYSLSSQAKTWFDESVKH
jgi:hypothetical protein